eukprot:m51a1_g13253 hypothetical protein (367) ;mRNA; r:1449-2549
MMLDWQHGVETLEPLLAQQAFQVRGSCGLQVAACYTMLGQHERAAEVWKRIPTLTQKVSAVDHYVHAWAAQYLRTGGHLSAFEMLYVRRDLSKMAHVMADARALLDRQALAAGVITPDGRLTDPPAPALPAGTVEGGSGNGGNGAAAAAPAGAAAGAPAQGKGKGFLSGLKAIKNTMVTVIEKSVARKEEGAHSHFWDNRASYLMLKGAMLKYQRNLGDEEAMACFQDVAAVQQGLLFDRWYVAYSLFELCESYSYLGKPEQAAAMLKRCIACKDYLWEDPLKMRIRVTADQLKRGPAADEVLLTASGVSTRAAVDVDDDDGEEEDPADRSGSPPPTPSAADAPGAHPPAAAPAAAAPAAAGTAAP